MAATEQLQAPKNKGGRPKGSRTVIPTQTRVEIARAFQAHAHKCLDFYLEVLEDEDKPDNIRVQAADRIMDRGYGKPMTSMELSGAEGKDLIPQPGSLTGMSGAELQAIGTVLKSMMTKQPGDDAVVVDIEPEATSEADDGFFD